MNSLEILQALGHLRVRYAGVYPADRLPRVWTRSTAIVANTDNHDQPGRHWVAFYVDEHGTGTYFDSYGLPPWTPDSSYAYVETPPPTDGTPPPCKEYSLKPADTTAAYFYILCLTVIILGSFLIYLPMIVNAMTD
ncbi:PREDICTED: uncharacterized protein LOC105556375 [Vollenhovia emeryi]|uniref:uncharacterized protein LOC105556375 n=1 Tax=Vollenhovia emeryi TaxID=411798 RepID=UPI0005F3CFCE|nr:PREDICTED: uncharacterized protein LOC105556375 [Vollenhovia emeryi]